MKGLHQENRHLAARDRIVGAVVSVGAAGGNLFGSELVDPIDERTSGAGLVGEHRGCTSRGYVGPAVLTFQEKHRHLSPSDGVIRGIVASATAARDAFGSDLIHPVDERTARAGLVRKHRGRAHW